MPLVRQLPQPVQRIRLALLAGVLLFGAVTLYVHGQPSWKPGALPPAVSYALLAYAIIAVAIANAMSGRVRRASDPQRRATLLILGWAVGEGAGLLGGVIFFVTGEGQWYLVGLVVMIVSFALLRTKEAA